MKSQLIHKGRSAAFERLADFPNNHRVLQLNNCIIKQFEPNGSVSLYSAAETKGGNLIPHMKTTTSLTKINAQNDCLPALAG